MTSGNVNTALAAIASGAGVRTAVRRRAAALAARLTAEGLDADVRVLANGDAEVVVTGPGLFAREFGGLQAPADPTIQRVIDTVTGEAP
jgi:hypothetical protein